MKSRILEGSCAVVPEPRRKAMLMLVHEQCQGMCRMKALARMFVWWPGINADIEELVGGHCGCQ